jgi:hypothetical protein
VLLGLAPDLSEHAGHALDELFVGPRVDELRAAL